MMAKVVSFRREHIIRAIVIAVILLLLVRYGWLYVSSPSGHQSSPLLVDTKLRSFETSHGQYLLNGKPVRMLSGAIHYFRVVPEYWPDRLQKLKAAGLNTVETYVPWNKHEETQGQYDFAGMLNIRLFIQMAADLDLLVILRPGPYICAEWEFGGLPSWLLSDPAMRVRSTYPPYLEAVDLYFKKLFEQVADLQFHRGGPVVMIQIENELGSYGEDPEYLEALRQLMIKHGIEEMFFTSDNNYGLQKGGLPGKALLTANFKNLAVGTEMFNYLKKVQPDKPLTVMELWSGWFDSWEGKHNTWSVTEYSNILKFILDADASVNLYMFHGGTSFGFMNGANEPQVPQTTSYDYDAPLSECGDVTDKYWATRELLMDYLPKDTVLPPVPPNLPKTSYGTLEMKSMMIFADLVSLVDPIASPGTRYMESLSQLNNGGGQSYGFVLYRHTAMPNGRNLTLSGQVHDRAIVLLNGREFTTIDYDRVNSVLPLEQAPKKPLQDANLLEILVENLGRVNYASFESQLLNNQRKGYQGALHVDQHQLKDFEIYPLEFKDEFLLKASDAELWGPLKWDLNQPALYRADLYVKGKPQDTFLNMEGWTKGVVFVNRFNLGRYWSEGPTRTLYLPGPLLRTGSNQVIVFELHQPSAEIRSVPAPVLG